MRESADLVRNACSLYSGITSESSRLVVCAHWTRLWLSSTAELLFFVVFGLILFRRAVALLSLCRLTGINSAVDFGRLWDSFAFAAFARVGQRWMFSARDIALSLRAGQMLHQSRSFNESTYILFTLGFGLCVLCNRARSGSGHELTIAQALSLLNLLFLGSTFRVICLSSFIRCRFAFLGRLILGLFAGFPSGICFLFFVCIVTVAMTMI